MNRFDLEEAISNLDQVGEDVDTIIYAIGDSPIKYTEDQILNMLIGTRQLHDARVQKALSILEQLIKENKII